MHCILTTVYLVIPYICIDSVTMYTSVYAFCSNYTVLNIYLLHYTIYRYVAVPQRRYHRSSPLRSLNQRTNIQFVDKLLIS